MPFTKLKGRELLLLDVIYQRGSKKTNWNDYLNVVYKDLITNKKEKITIENPEIDLFIVKPEYRNFSAKSTRHHLPLEMLDRKTVKYKNVLKEIANIAGGPYKEYWDTCNASDRKNLYKYAYCLGGDIPIETYYRVLWAEQVGHPDKTPITKLFLDIEVDQIDYEGNIAREGECEVNAVTILDDNRSICHTFLFDNNKNPQIKDFIKDQKKFQKRLHEEFDERNGEFEYRIYMFTDELEMLIQLFKLINTLNLDFSLIWNMGYDIPYLISRFRVLGMAAEQAMCSKDFPTESLYYFEDKHSFEFANKRDYFNISAYVHYLDQCINYASLRKSQGAVKKVNLDAIAAKEKVPGKITYNTKATIRTLPYVDYVLFVIYNIGDVLTQCMIERKVKDTENLYNIVTTNHVGYTDALKQTVTFRGLMYGYCKQKDIIIGHNANFGNKTNGKFDENGDYIGDIDDEDESFQGAINGDPLLNMENGLELFGKPSKLLLGLTIDFDFSSMYPFSITTYNIFATTMIGKLFIFKFNLENPYDEDMGKEYIEDIICGNLDHIGKKWHNLSDTGELALKIKRLYY